MKYIRISETRIRYEDNNGLPAVGYKVYTCDPGTTTLAQSWQDKDFVGSNTNPIVLNSRGEAQVFAQSALKLIFCLPTSTGPTNGVIRSDDWLGEQVTTNLDVAVTDGAGANNNYIAAVTPPYLSLLDGFILIFFPNFTNTETVGSTDSSGVTGKNDCVFSGPYTGSTPGSIFSVQIDSVSPGNGHAYDTVKWKKDGGAWTTDIAVTPGILQLTIDGMSFKFSEATGHTLNDVWTVTVATPPHLNFCSLGNWIIYKNVAGVQKALSGGDMISGVPAMLTKSGSTWILNNPSTETGGGEGGTASGQRSRKEVTGNYTLNPDTDAGNLIDFANLTAATLTLDPAINYNGMFFYVRAGELANVVIQADGAEVIYSPQNPTGANTYTLQGGCGMTIQLQCNGVSWEVLTMAVPPASIQGLANNLVITVTADATLTVTADEVVLESNANNYYTARGVSLTISLATAGANGLDTGSEASNTWYSVWVIYNGSTVAGLLSTSATNPVLPTGYEIGARVGWVRNNAGSNLIRTLQIGKTAQYVNQGGAGLPAMASVSGPGTSAGAYVAIAVGSFVPSTAKAINVVASLTGSTPDFLAIAPNNLYTIAPGSNPPIVCIILPSSITAAMILESTNIYYAYALAGGGTGAYVLCFGWEDK